MEQQVQILKQDDVAYITLQRPEVRNAFHPQMIQEITKAFKAFAKDKTLRAIILSGAGKSFCAGADLEWMKSMAQYTYAQNLKDAEKLYEMFWAIKNCDVPVVGQVHGAVFGGALGLLSVCDIVFAQAATKFCFSEVRLGLAPAVISSFVKEKMHASAMTRYFLTGAVFDSEEAQRSGLVHEIVAEGQDLEQTVKEYLKKEILVAGPQAVRATKKLLREINSIKSEKQLKKTTTQSIARLRVSAEGQEGLSAFFEKRPARWRPS